MMKTRKIKVGEIMAHSFIPLAIIIVFINLN